jgi:hypothetical protein
VIAHLDTHVALWLAAGEKRRLKAVAARLRRSALFVSPVVLEEMEVLREIGRLRAPVLDVWEVLSEEHGVREAMVISGRSRSEAGRSGGREIHSTAASCPQARWVTS